MRKYNVNIIRVIRGQDYSQQMTDSKQQLESDTPILLKMFLERIACGAFDDHGGCVSIGVWLTTKFHFATSDVIVVNAEETEKADILEDRLGTSTTIYKLEVNWS